MQPVPEPLRQLLGDAGVGSLAELTQRPVAELVPLIERMAIPASEAVLGALVLSTVEQMRQATVRLDQGTSRLLAVTWVLAAIGVLTLAVAIITAVRG